MMQNTQRTKAMLKNNEKVQNQEKGITLIALIVTIVIMLILAGVTIKLAIDDNGVIDNAKEAKDQYEQAQADADSGLNDLSSEMKKLMEENRKNNTETSTNINASQITADDYGKVVTNYKDGNTWEILYADNKNIYLIIRNNIGNQTINGKITEYNGTGDFNGSTTFKTKYPAIQAGWLNKTYTPSTTGTGTVNYTSTNNNMKATEYLLDSSVWNTNYKTNKSDWAIGGPTLELFVAAYNKKFPAKAVTIATPTGNGYIYEDTLSSNGSLPANDSATTGTIKSNLFNHGYYYWLACPSSSNSNNVRIANSEGAYVDAGSYSLYIPVRPVVCLSSGVTLTKSADGNTFTID